MAWQVSQATPLCPISAIAGLHRKLAASMAERITAGIGKVVRARGKRIRA